jgi:hypothetical protein
MDENKSALIKKIGEGNKSLSVIVAEEKLAKFKKFSQSINLSMGYLLNQAIDRYLANNSTEIFSTPTGIPTNTPIGINAQVSNAKDGLDIEELINTTIKTYLLNNPIGSVTKDDIEELINTYGDNRQSIGMQEVEKLIEGQVEPLADLLTELETYTQNQFKAVREELRATSDRSVTTESIAIPANTPTDKDPSVKSWAEFFKMVGIEALTATDAQKKDNIDTRTKQIEQGLQAAKERGLGDWTVKVAGRSFEKLTEV